MRGKSLKRVIALVELLQRSRWTINELAVELNVTTRTIRRDLQILAETYHRLETVHLKDGDKYWWLRKTEAGPLA